tara:strand:+ start:1363 stop:1629 length:267 start_codon:yes stop_codon:yes gene_type:complete
MSNNTLQRFDSIEFAKNLPEATLENPRPDTFNDNVKLNFKRKLVFNDPPKKRRKKRGGKSLTKKRKTKRRRRRRVKTKRRRKRRTRKH